MTRIHAAFAALLLGGATAAHADPSVSSIAYGAADASASGVLIDFDHPLPASFTLTGGLQRTVDDGFGAQPAIAPGVKGSSTYWSINPGDPGTLLSTVGYSTVSFLWGSIDSYNTLSLLNADGSTLARYTGDAVYPPSDGEQFGAATNRRVTFRADDATRPIYGLKLESSSPAFEVDDITFDGAVPEPATWAMMLIGFGGIGTMLRRRRRAEARIRFA